MLYLVSYDLVKPEQDYASLWTALKQAGAVRILYSEWLVSYANVTPKAVADYFIRYMDGNDRIFVTEVPSNFAYRNLLADPKAA